ncbi:MAG TPA: dihydroorotase [Bacteroidales bacterium]|jgi:dihydroorotase|nr:dihydroorotase [Bacteroidales bacterium]
MSSLLIKNATIVNEGKSFKADLLIVDDLISAIGNPGEMTFPPGTEIIDAEGKLLLPGVIDDQVHFREPGLTYKAEILTESRAAAAGGVTSFMDMPNTIPQTVTMEALDEKYKLGAAKSLINYSFYIGATNDNLAEVMKADPSKVCGIKVFMGSSTGNMLVDNEKALRDLFANASMPVASHCEDEQEIRKNTALYKSRYGEDVPVRLHPFIRTREACLISSQKAVELASKYNTRLHILHLSTADELKLFSNELPLSRKKITAEVCVHHLWFEESSYDTLGSSIKWNPAVKTSADRDALRNAVNRNIIDVVATDHAPHTAEEKQKPYFQCPSGGPLVQHSLVTMLELWHRKIFTLEKIVEMMCHNPAILFNIRKRGFIREGYKADLCIVEPNDPWTVSSRNILYKCGWSPFDGTTFQSKVLTTIVNGTMVYNKGVFREDYRGEKLMFER